MPTVNEELFDRAVSHQIGLQRYSTATVNKIIALLNRVDADIVRQIEKYDPTELGPSAAQKRLDKMLDAIRVLLRDSYSAAGRQLRKDLLELAEYEADFQLRLLADAMPFEWDTVSPSPSMLKAAVDSRPFQGAVLKEWVKGLEDGAFRRLRDSIRIGVTEGETIKQIVKRAVGTEGFRYKDGVTEVSRRSAETMVRTAVNHVATRAREDLYKANADLVKAVRWVSTLDSKTSAVCRGRDGQTYPPDKGPRPPAHPNCRSTTVPVLKSLRELGLKVDDVPEGTRASMDGQVPQGMSYSDWLRTKSAAFQDDVLGPTKGKLFRKGELTLDRFIDTTGREYTLDELRKRDAEAFRKAGL
jgi:SPP1 gp7 family putative phage head morphogenesis protein